MAELDEKVCKQMDALVELLTTSGKPTLNPEIMKKFKKFCRISDGYVQHAFQLLMKQLSVKHAEVRISAYQMVDELFMRSHMFRELLLADFDTFLDLAAGTEKKNPLPPPKAVAENMKNSVNRSILLWVEKFGHAYKKLTLGFEFLKNFKKIDFDSIQATIDLERQQKEDTNRKLEACRKEKLDKVKKEHSESELEIQLCLTEVENGLQLLMPRPDDFFISLRDEAGTSTKSNSVTSTVTSSVTSTVTSSMASSSQNDYTEKDKTDHSPISGNCYAALQSDKEENEIDNKHKPDENEIRNADFPELNKKYFGNEKVKCDDSQKISGTDSSEESQDTIDDDDDDDDEFEEVDTSENGAFTQEHGLFDRKFALTVELGQSTSSLQETEDNRDLIQGVRDQYTLIKTKYLPTVKRWIQVLTENSEKEEKIKQLTDVKTKLEDAVKKCVELEIARSKRNRDNDSDSDEDDFEEVPEKEGYEEDVPEHVQMEAAMAATSKASKSTGRKKRTLKKAKTESKSAQKKLGIKNVKQLARDILESGRLLEEDDMDSAMLKSQALYVGQKSAKTSSCTAPFMGHLDTEEKHSQRKTVANQGSVKQTGIDKNGSQSSSYIQKVKTETQSDDVTASHSLSFVKTETLAENRTESQAVRSGKEPSDRKERKNSLLEKAPFVDFGVDLEHWENPDKIKAPVKNRFDDASRFWVPDRDVDDQEPGGSEEVASLSRRSFTYVGEFEPVKWKCRAPLTDGRLCDRMDRVKCPFHGKVIGRDKEGCPTNPADLEQIYRDNVKKESDGTEDNLSESEARSSRSSKGKGQGKGKGKKKAKKVKYPNLTEIKESKDNSRTRIEAKIFNRSTMRKVNKALDAETLKKLSNKFSHQFNYSLK